MLLVDLSNVLHSGHVLPWEEGGLEAPGLIRLIGRSRWGRGKGVLVGDGGSRDESEIAEAFARHWPKGLVRWAGPGREADDVLEHLILTDSAPGRLTVVSSDRRIVRRASARGASVKRSDRFLLELWAGQASTTKPRPAFATDLPLDAGSVGHWLREFGLRESRVGRLRRSAGRPGPEQRAPSPPPPPAPGSDLDTTKPGKDDGAAGVKKAMSVDPLLLDLLQRWAGGVDPADLDMERWLDEGPQPGEFERSR